MLFVVFRCLLVVVSSSLCVICCSGVCCLTCVVYLLLLVVVLCLLHVSVRCSLFGVLCVDCCLLFGYCLWFAASCLRVGYCSVCVVRCLSLVVWCFLCSCCLKKRCVLFNFSFLIVRCSLSLVYWLAFGVCVGYGTFGVVCCVLFTVCC